MIMKSSSDVISLSSIFHSSSSIVSPNWFAVLILIESEYAFLDFLDVRFSFSDDEDEIVT